MNWHKEGTWGIWIHSNTLIYKFNGSRIIKA